MQVAVVSRKVSQNDAESFFRRMPKALPIYRALEDAILTMHPDAVARMLKTQVTFSNRHGFAYAWLPARDVKGRPDDYLVLSLGLPRRIDSPRIEQASEPYPGRWMHHLIIDSPDTIDSQLIGWIELAYRFALERGANRPAGSQSRNRPGGGQS